MNVFTGIASLKHLNQVKNNPKRSKKNKKIKMKNIDCKFQSWKQFPNIGNEKKKINIMYFGFENKDHMELFLMKNKPKLQGDKSNHVYIKDFNRFMYNKTKHKEKKYYQLFPLI